MAKRLLTEKTDLEKEGFIVEQKTDSLWEITIRGPASTPF